MLPLTDKERTQQKLIRTQRKAFGISQRELANALFVSYGTVCRWENCKARCRMIDEVFTAIKSIVRGRFFDAN